MAKIVRKTAQVFGLTAGVDEIAQFGSLQAASPNFSTDPDTIQALSNWGVGWFDAVEDVNSPAIEDMNAYCYVTSYQLAYAFQAGVAEWDSGTTYYIGSIAQNGTGGLYISSQNNNLNHALTDAAYWDVFSISGNAATATKLLTARNINGVAFDGTASITVTAAAGTLTGATLNSTVTASSLTSVGTLGSLTVSGSVSGGSFVPSASSVPTNGMYLPSANSIAFATNTTLRGSISSAGLWTIGTSASTANHVINGAAITLQSGVSGIQQIVCKNTGASSGTNGAAAIYAVSGASSSYAYFLSAPGNGATNWFSGNINNTVLWSVNYGGGSGLPDAANNYLTIDNSGNTSIIIGNMAVSTAGKGLQVKEGTNGKQGVVTLVGGTATVTTTSVTANSRIFLTAQSLGTVAIATALAVTARTAGTSFVITSANATDTSVVAYELFEPA